MALKVRGIQYDVGITTVEGGNSRPELTAERMAAELDLVARELHANAVRVTGGDPERIAVASHLATERGLEVWVTPQLVNGTPEETLALLGACADVAQGLRRGGCSVVLVAGCELSAFMAGVIPGRDVMERLSLLSDPERLMPAVVASGVDPQERMAAFIREAAALARGRFDGPASYSFIRTWPDGRTA